MRNLIKYTTLVLSAICMATASYAQSEEGATTASLFKPVAGVVYDANTKAPIQSASVSSPYAFKTVYTNAQGHFRIQLRSREGVLKVSHEGYFDQEVQILGRDSLVVYLQRPEMTRATNRFSTIGGEKSMSDKLGSANAINKKDLSLGYSTTSDAMTGLFPSLRVTKKSGLPGEGSVLNMRGIRSLFGQNTPVMVIDGVPIKSDQNLSNVINGFSSDIYDPLNLRDIEQITLLKGADALPYGSLGSNGVLVIETDKGIAGETQVEVKSTQGISFITRQIPVMKAVDFKDYIQEISIVGGLTHNQLLTRYPFLRDDLDYVDRLRYANDNNWQDEIYKPAFTSDNSLKVKGGDAVVQYLLNAGYQVTNGVVDPSNVNKFYTRANTNITFSEKMTANASIAFDYSDMRLIEQGMTKQTNPLLAAYAFSPFSSPYQYDIYGKQLDEYTQYDPIMMISNPVAMKTEVEALTRRFDMLINTGVIYKFMPNLVLDLKFGIYYNYKKEDMFSGGMTSDAVAPIIENTRYAWNTVRSGSTESKNYYGKAALRWNETFKEKHNVSAVAGWQIMSNKETASSGVGANTANDKFRNLGKVSANTRRSTGYNDVWHWMSGYLGAEYNYNYQWYASAMGMVDISNTYGRNSDRAFIFPAVQLGWRMSNASFLSESNSISNLMLRAEYSVNPNSRFNSRYSKYYYVIQLVRDVSGLVRAGIPNMYLEPEKVHNINVGVDFSMFGDKINASLDVYQEDVRDMLFESKISPGYGFNTMFKNDGRLRNRGIELGINGLVFDGNFRWMLGANLGHYQSEIRSLGAGVTEQIVELDNGVTVINRVGEAPYSYYGHVAKGVYADDAQANEYGYRTTGAYQYQGGDVIFKDRDGDRMISDFDREILGNPNPDLYGNVYSMMTYKNLSLFMNWGGSYGNEIYNGVRRNNESGSDHNNQAESMKRRWKTPGQVTDIPRVTYVDGGMNNRFSSRWIEDGSYIKLKEITLSYDINRKVLFFTGLKVYLTAENLLTFTKYSGSDPEFSYSYDMELMGMDLAKIPVPKSVKIGVVMNF